MKKKSTTSKHIHKHIHTSPKKYQRQRQESNTTHNVTESASPIAFSVFQHHSMYVFFSLCHDPWYFFSFIFKQKIDIIIIKTRALKNRGNNNTHTHTCSIKKSRDEKNYTRVTISANAENESVNNLRFLI